MPILDVRAMRSPDVEAYVSAELVARMLKRATEMAILPNCTVFRGEGGLFQLVSNMER